MMPPGWAAPRGIASRRRLFSASRSGSTGGRARNSACGSQVWPGGGFFFLVFVMRSSRMSIGTSIMLFFEKKSIKKPNKFGFFYLCSPACRQAVGEYCVFPVRALKIKILEQARDFYFLQPVGEISRRVFSLPIGASAPLVLACARSPPEM